MTLVALVNFLSNSPGWQTAIATSNTLALDQGFVSELKAKVDQEIQATVIATRIVDGWSNPSQSGSYLSTYADFPLE